MGNLLYAICAIVLIYVITFTHRRLWKYIRLQINLQSDLPKDEKFRYLRTIILGLGMIIGVLFWNRLIELSPYSIGLIDFGKLAAMSLTGIICLFLLECLITIIDFQKH